MSNILIHMTVEPHGEYDIFGCTDYQKMAELFRKKNISCPNLGNRLWFQGLISEISCSENKLTYFRENMTKDYINANFDMIVAPMANVFHKAFKDLLLRLAERFRGIKIPVYVIACGVQADTYDVLDDLCEVIGEPARAFMRSVYDTGGEFALRGYFSKEFFDRMGFSSAVVTGCPSMYQLGRDLQITTEKVPVSEFKPLINGSLEEYLSLAEPYSGAEFFDQERFFHYLHDPDCQLDIRSLVHHLGYDGARWLLGGKVRMIPNMNDWWNYLQQSGFNFSFGSRIHGSIMPILAGIPALMEVGDSRTQEMAEFFRIPIIDGCLSEKGESLYERYLKVDYTIFNSGFSEKYDKFESFLVEHGIVQSINQQNLFLQDATTKVMNGNHDKLSCRLKVFRKQYWLWKIYDAAHRWKKQIAR